MIDRGNGSWTPKFLTKGCITLSGIPCTSNVSCGKILSSAHCSRKGRIMPLGTSANESFALYPDSAKLINYFGRLYKMMCLSRWWDLNPRLALYERATLPLSYIGKLTVNL